ncbi:unnamed protein product [Urochloa decumbens]|uniref:BTB domain-containing protein n=1 Tax=Urochloa decumbens TaxID=240449 RepID=A0ABC9DIR7_9POAL
MQNYAACINLTDFARSVQLFKIDAFAASYQKQDRVLGWTRTSVGGYDWRIDYYPNWRSSSEYWIKFCITLDSVATGVAASFACRLLDPAEKLGPSPVPAVSATLGKGQGKDVFLMLRTNLLRLPQRCLLPQVATVSPPTTAAAAPSSDLHRHFGELWRSQMGADVTFLVSGQHIAAHRYVLAARSPVFKAQLFGDMKEKAASQRQSVVKTSGSMSSFIYTDTSPELDSKEEDAKALAQHLLAAADRYGMERLKVICEERMCAGISVGTVATALALAEQHGCSKLKARCMEFMVATPANLREVVATDGYKHLMASCPSVLSDLLVARYK